MRKFTKLFTTPKVLSLNEENREAEFIISSDHIDRYGEIVEQKWLLEEYKKNPIVLFGHNPSTADNVLGTCLGLEVKDGEDNHKITVAKMKFAEAGTSKNADTVFSLVKQGILKTVSVGFIPHIVKHIENENKNGEEDTETTVLSDNELLEFSIVPIPANPNAVALAYGDGSITEKDARYLVGLYEKEAKYLRSSLYDTIEKKKQDEENKEMSDEDIKKLAEALGAVIDEKIGKKLDELSAKLDGKDDEEDNTDNTDGEDNSDGEDQKLNADDADDKDEEEEKALMQAIEEMTPEEARAFAKENGLM